jgi:hypothetical protein
VGVGLHQIGQSLLLETLDQLLIVAHICAPPSEFEEISGEGSYEIWVDSYEFLRVLSCVENMIAAWVEILGYLVLTPSQQGSLAQRSNEYYSGVELDQDY